MHDTKLKGIASDAYENQSSGLILNDILWERLLPWVELVGRLWETLL
jgi:hypothetical protein